MKIKIGDKVYSDKEVPILLIVDNPDDYAALDSFVKDKCKKVVFYPDGWSQNQAIDFMKSYDGTI